MVSTIELAVAEARERDGGREAFIDAGFGTLLEHSPGENSWKHTDAAPPTRAIGIGKPHAGRITVEETADDGVTETAETPTRAPSLPPLRGPPRMTDRPALASGVRTAER